MHNLGLFKQVIDAIGEDAAEKLIAAFAGESVYIPKIDCALRMQRDTNIRSSFRGNNIRELAAAYNLTGTQLRNILYKHKDKKAPEKFDMLIKLLGRRTAFMLCEELGGSSIYVPLSIPD
jgi:Mor family transcriptional regulator